MSGIGRRDLLRGGALAAAALSLEGCVSQACDGEVGIPPRDPAIWIDAHAHVFNAADLPVEGFIRDVVLDSDEQRGRRVIEPLVISIVRGVKRRAPGYQEERDLLDALLAGDAAAERELLRPPPSAEELRRWSDEECDRDEMLRRQVDTAVDTDAELTDRAGAYRLTAIGRLVDWLRLFSSYRYRNVHTLIATYPQIQVFCPALVDFMTALGKDEDPINRKKTTTMAQQIDLMERIARLCPGKLLPFVAFDPCRWALADPDRRKVYLAKVKHAVEHRGFVGVKMYPAMGFYPLGNEGLLPPGEGKFGRVLDEGLRELYTWCTSAEGDVPILAHCKNSRGRRKDDAERGHPDAWRVALLDQPGFERLRLNLGHFGSDEDLLENGRESWSWAAARVMQSYANVYADVGNDELIAQGGRKARKYVNRLRDLYGAYPEAKERVMYGSDWLFVALARNFEEHHTANRSVYRTCLPDVAHGFLGDNAARFLGLAPGERTHARLVEWYERHELRRPTWLK